MPKPHAICGDDAGYQRHRALGEVPCRVCCDAHAAYMAHWRSRGRVRAVANPLQYRAARLGHEPAEVLTTSDRHRLVAELHRLGWPDEVIAAHTRMSTYTTARIRGALGVLPNSRPAAKDDAA